VPESPLHAAHADLDARFTDFGGWTMPVQYEGVLAEHAAVRTGVGVFDVSHLGRFAVTGPGAAELLRGQLCNDIRRIEPGRAQYTMALNERGGVVDDIIVWRFSDDDFWVMPNGTNFDEISDRFRSGAGPGITVEPVRNSTVLLAVQGPDSPGVVEAVLGSMPRRFRVESGGYGDSWYRAAGTGYTGERGAEIAVPVASGAALFTALVGAGGTPAGLGARDTLRLEMGYPLWGQDLDEDTTPLEAGLEWVVAWDHEFIGRPALITQRDHGVPRLLVPFQTEGRSIPRHGNRLRSGGSVGTVTSGNFSPTLRHGIGMGYLAPPPDAGAAVQVEIRKRWIEAERVILPFLDR
jgi:aminomethyltransferase